MLFEFLVVLGGFIVTVIIADWRRNLAHNRRFDRMNEPLDRINERFDRQNERFEEIVQLIFSEHGNCEVIGPNYMALSFSRTARCVTFSLRRTKKYVGI